MDPLLAVNLGSRRRRKRGTGSIFPKDGGWIAAIRTTTGIHRRRAPDYPEAKRMLKWLMREYRDELSIAYRPWRRPDLERKPLKPKVRFAILRRDGFSCRYCGHRPPDVELHVDHLISVLDGGTDDSSNLVTACTPCNAGKGSRSIQHGELPALPPIMQEVA